MAAIKTQSVEQNDKLSIRVMVDKERNRVLYAEAGKDFLDALFSFLTLPLGTIARLVAAESNIEAVRFGSISSLYQSVSDLDQEYLWSHTCKEMLLKPTNSKEMLLRDKLLILTRKRHVLSAFVLSVVDLLKLSLISKSPLTDFILKKNQPVDYLNLRHNFEFMRSELPSDEDRQMSVKVTLRKSNEQILFVEAGDDFIDFVFSFLTFPLGGVLHMLQGFSSICCIDKFYKSLSDLSQEMYFMSEGLKEKLTMPLIAAQFELSNQILPIDAATLPINYCHTYCDDKSRCVINLTKEAVYSHNNIYFPEKFVPFKLADPKSSIAKSSFVKGPSIYMVTDDLLVTPMSSISAMSYIKRLKVPLSDLEERVLKIGVKEGLSILKASLISTSTLTYGLKQFIRTIKVEN